MASGGDTLEVKLRDGAYNAYFKDKAKIKNRKEMRHLMEKLRDMGVHFPSEDWFD